MNGNGHKATIYLTIGFVVAVILVLGAIYLASGGH